MESRILDGPVVIRGVQHNFHPAVILKEWPSKDRRSRIVFITRDIDESVLRDTLKMFTDAQARRPELRPNESGHCDIAIVRGTSMTDLLSPVRRIRPGRARNAVV